MTQPGIHHHETHYINRVGWLRAAVLGANDGIVSTASLVLGIAASGASREAVLLSGVAALVAGAMSMAAGEYVSVSAQIPSGPTFQGKARRWFSSRTRNMRNCGISMLIVALIRRWRIRWQCS